MELVGRIDWVYNIRINPLELDFSQFTKPECSVCKTSHMRKVTYIVEDDNGALMQVGGSCLKKLMGYIPEHRDCSEKDMFAMLELGLHSNGDGCYDTKEFLFALCLYQEKYGFYKQMSYDNLVTNREFKEYLLSIKHRDYSEVEKMIEWYKQQETNNSFMYNLREMIVNNQFSIKYFNIIKYARKVYLEAINYIPDYNSVEVVYTTTTIKDIFLADTRVESYGYNATFTEHCYYIVDTKGNVFYYKTAKEDTNLKAGDTITYKLKSYKDYEGNVVRNVFHNKKYGVVNKISYVKKLA